MSTLKVYDQKGASVGDLEVAEGLLVQDERGGQAVKDVVVAIQAARRAGTASTLAKGEVAGSNRKPWRQKGTGRARAGYRQSPVWRGGGIVFGPKPRDYGVKVNRKVAKLALRRALSDRIVEDRVKVLDGLELPEGKTRLFAGLMKSLGVKAPVLVVDVNVQDNVRMAARNVPGVEVVRADDLNAYQVVRFRTLMITKAGMEQIEKRLAGKMEEAAA